MKNIANYISISRILMSILLMITNTFTISFYMLYMYCGLSDMLDGFLARKYKITSEIGAKIDSIADMVFIFVSIIKVLPVLNLSKAIGIWIIIIAMIKVFNIICGYVYYKKLMLPHTILNKITGFVLFIIPLIMQWIDLEIVEILICVLATFSALQEGHCIKTRKI